MAIKILVVEDEKRMYNYLKKMLLKIDASFAEEGPVAGVAELRDVLLSGEHYDLLISDVRINGGTCFNAFEVVQPTMPVICSLPGRWLQGVGTREHERVGE